MFMPSVFSDGDDVMNEMMNEWGNDWNKNFFGKHNPLFGKRARNLMKTDVKETDNSYELEVDLPGFKKDEASTVRWLSDHLRGEGSRQGREEARQTDSPGALRGCDAAVLLCR